MCDIFLFIRQLNGLDVRKSEMFNDAVACVSMLNEGADRMSANVSNSNDLRSTYQSQNRKFNNLCGKLTSDDDMQ